ncbi:flagellar protein FlgN [Natroniella sp. ANB-PHB2]|uniref:flagellar protein FlgN n=1 Tax=Natroniella sp. ANB-PHB2 TaxID=3384444 RepID=UPI0038D492F5
MKAKRIINDLIEIYGQDLKLYKKLFSLTEEQREIITEIDDFESDYFDQLEELLVKKDGVMKEIEQVEQKLLPYKAGIIKGLNLSQDEWLKEFLDTDIVTDELKEIINDLVELIKRLQQLDQENQTLINSKKDKLVQEMNQVKKGVKVNKSYNPQVRIHSTYIDDKS